MGQALSSCAPCCSSTATEDVESYQMADTNPQWKEKVETNCDKIVLAVDPKSNEEEIAADRMKIDMTYIMDINGGDKNRVFLHVDFCPDDLIKITEGTVHTVSEGTIFMRIDGVPISMDLVTEAWKE